MFNMRRFSEVITCCGRVCYGKLYSVVAWAPPASCLLRRGGCICAGGGGAVHSRSKGFEFKKSPEMNWRSISENLGKMIRIWDALWVEAVVIIETRRKNPTNVESCKLPEF